MNFYKHHLGDYAQATGHLSFVEDAAYSRLLRKYYAEEKPIPGDLKAAQRLVGARTREEKEAVQTVLEEFFEFDPESNVWRNKRAEEELSKAAAQAETNRRIAEEREARKRARNEHDQSTNRSKIKYESSHDQSTNRQPSQTPDSRLQYQDQEQQGGSADAEPRPDDPADLTPTRSDPIPYQAIVDAYNQRMTQLAKVRLINGQRRTAIRRAWQSLPPEHRQPGAFKAIFAECAMDDFLNGNGPYSGEHANWRPDFDHLIKIKTLTKVYEKAMARRERMRQSPEPQQPSGASA